jgi:hypothetical protein
VGRGDRNCVQQVIHFNHKHFPHSTPHIGHRSIYHATRTSMLVICIINHPTCTINPSPLTVVTPISQLLFHDLISSQIYEFFFKNLEKTSQISLTMQYHTQSLLTHANLHHIRRLSDGLAISTPWGAKTKGFEISTHFLFTKNIKSI